MLIRQKAFENVGRHLKGALHCHTTRSDGDSSPEAVVSRYYEDGFDFIAITDHFIYNRKSPVPHLPITVIPAAEGGCCFDDVKKGFRAYHTVFLGRDDESNGFSQDERIPDAHELSPTGRITGAAEYQPYLDMIRDKGNIFFYCHPEWSSTPTRYFEDMQGNFALEIRNTDCVLTNELDANCPCWDELLGQGKRLFGVAVDDIHRLDMPDRSWVMVNSENSVPDILDALESGAFYSSFGPRIYDFYVEDGIARVKCDTASRVEFISDCHAHDIVRSTQGISFAECDLNNDYAYVRACVVDLYGRRAWTNPIFLD